jgi:hypothetical protein
VTPPTVIQPADWACVPAFQFVGKLIEVGQWLNGDGFAPYEHVLGYAGYYHTTPQIHRPVPITGHGPGHYVIEAMPGGARFRRLDGDPQDIPGALWSSGHYDLDIAKREHLVQIAIAYLGTPYSGLDYAALSAHRLRLHPIDNMLQARIKSGRHMICSQYWDRVYNRAGIELFTDDRWDGYVTPLHMARLLMPKAVDGK